MNEPDVRQQHIVLYVLAFVARALVRALEFVFSKGVTIRTRLTEDDDGKKELRTQVKLEAFDADGQVEQPPPPPRSTSGYGGSTWGGSGFGSSYDDRLRR